MRVSFSVAAFAVFCNLALADEAPRLEFEQTVIDFGPVEELATITGSFRFKNSGNGVLKMRQPSSSCGCTVPILKKETLGPGETGEVEFTWKIGKSRGSLRRTITVSSNDPQKPQVDLTIKADSSHTYDVSPDFIRTDVPIGGRRGNFSIDVNRRDGKPLRILRIDSSQPWIVASIDPRAKPGDGAARISVEVQGSGTPRRFSEFIHIFADDKADAPVASISVFGEILGELTVSPQRLLWSLAESADERRAGVLTRRLNIRSSTGRAFELKNPASSIPELSVTVNRADDGRSFDVTATLKRLPDRNLSGFITFDTSMPSAPRIEVPVEINVFRQPVTSRDARAVQSATFEPIQIPASGSAQ